MPLLYARAGDEFAVNSTIANSQLRPDLTPLTGGGFVAVWTDSSGLGGDSSGTSVKAQRYDSAGNPVGPELLVNTTTLSDQSEPTVIPTANGGFLVAWTDKSGQGGDPDWSIKGQFFDSAGAKSGPELLLNSDTVGFQSRPALAELADGGFALTWAIPSTEFTNSPTSYRTQVFEADGTPRGFETLVANGSAASDAPAAIVGLVGGGYVVVWESDLYLQVRLFDADGNPVGDAHRLTQYPASEARPSIIALPDGGFVVAFQQDGSGGLTVRDVSAHVFDANAQPVGTFFKVSASVFGNQVEPSIAALPGGGYIITWQDTWNGHQNGFEIRGQIFDASHQRSGTEFRVNPVVEGNQQRPEVTVLSDGRIVVLWEGFDANGTEGIRGHILAPSAAPTDIALSNGEVIETAVENLPVADISAIGAINSNFTFAYLSDSAGGAFRVEGDQLVVADNGRLDAEIDDTVTVTLRVTDDNGHSYDEVITVQIGDSNNEDRYSAGPVSNLAGAGTDSARLANGNVVVVARNDPPGGSNNGDLIIHILDSSGNVVHGGLTLPAAENILHAPQVAALPGGGFVATWTKFEPDGTGYDVAGQRFDNSGTPLGASFIVSSTTSADQELPAVAGLPGGGFVIVWADKSGTGGDPNVPAVKAQLFNAAGAKVGTEFLVNTSTAGAQSSPSVGTLANGNFVVTWTDSSSGDSDIKAQIFTAAGAKVGGELSVNTLTQGAQAQPEIASLSNGGFAIVWTDTSGAGGDPDSPAVRAQVFNAAGTKVGSEILVNTTVAGAQWSPHIESLPGGGFGITWYNGSDGSAQLQRFDNLGNRVGTELLVSLTPVDDFVALQSGSLLLFGSDNFTTTRQRLLTLEHPVQAHNDTGGTLENGTATGNVLTNDFHQTGAELQVGAVNGQAANVGQTITLPSGATLILHANGNYTYNPNGAFNSLTGVSGAANSTGQDSFTYTLTNGTTATVNITVTGVASPGDRALGTPGNDVMTGTPQADFFDLRQGGNDNVNGAGGNDVFLFGRTMTTADAANGGAGVDQIILQGGGGLRFGTGVVGIESLLLLSGLDTTYGEVPRNLYAYPITMVDQNVAAGERLTVDGSGLRVRENLTFNGGAETDGSFLVYGGRGIDVLTGGARNDVFVFGADGHWGPGDRVIGGAGHDELILRGNYSLTFAADQITAIETLRLLSAKDPVHGPVGTNYSYNLTTNDANVAAGVQLTVDAAPLRGSETLTFNGSAETNGSFRVFGGHLGDTITGGAGADILQGNAGGDVLTGNGGADIFRYVAISDSRPTSADQILDFRTGDKIDLSQIDARTGPGNDSFTWIGSGAFTNQAGQLRATASGNVWTVQGDTDGNGIADFQIVVTVADNHALVPGDFML